MKRIVSTLMLCALIMSVAKAQDGVWRFYHFDSNDNQTGSAMLQEFIVDEEGWYSIEAWGGKGGDSRNSNSNLYPGSGGAQGTVQAMVYLLKNDKLYIVVAGRGQSANLPAVTGASIRPVFGGFPGKFNTAGVAQAQSFPFNMAWGGNGTTPSGNGSGNGTTGGGAGSGSVIYLNGLTRDDILMIAAGGGSGGEYGGAALQGGIGGAFTTTATARTFVTNTGTVTTETASFGTVYHGTGGGSCDGKAAGAGGATNAPGAGGAGGNAAGGIGLAFTATDFPGKGGNGGAAQNSGGGSGGGGFAGGGGGSATNGAMGSGSGGGGSSFIRRAVNGKNLTHGPVRALRYGGNQYSVASDPNYSSFGNGYVQISNTVIKAWNDTIIVSKPATPTTPINIGTVLKNDEYSGKVDFYLVNGPQRGTVTVNGNPVPGLVSNENELQYTQTAGIWEGFDEFEYRIVSPYSDTEGRAKSYILMLNQERFACDDAEIIRFTGHVPAGFNYVWYDSEFGGTIKADNTDLVIERSEAVNSLVTRWLSINYIPAGGVSNLFPNRIRVDTYFSVPWLVWTGAVSNDWNDPANWKDGSNNVSAVPPGPCTVVHIPGNVDLFPSLENGSTSRNLHPNGRLDGEPTCKDVYFHFGGEVAKPHYLKYERAFVHYNFGKYTTDTNIVGDPVNGDPYSTDKIMDRERWYALSSPLKKIFTGDFSLGGFPSMWQRGFKTYYDGNLTGEWYLPEEVMALEVGQNLNYAVSLYASGYSQDLGESDHRGLNELNGVFEMPYFETDLPVDQGPHRLHEYFPATQTSRWHYYYWQEPDLGIASRFDEHRRGQEAYRFIFEDNYNNPIAEFKMTIPVNVNQGQVSDVMIGNPFLSSFDFASFYATNSDKIEDHYRLYYDGAFETYRDGIFETYSGPNVPLIASLQGFFVTPKNVGSSVELTFTEDHSVARSNMELEYQLRSSAAGMFYNDYLRAEVRNRIGNSWIMFSFNENDRDNVIQLFSNDKDTVPQLYSLDYREVRNAFQYVADTEGEVVPLGVVCKFKGAYSISFDDVEKIPVESLILRDKGLGIEHDLLKNNVYEFTDTSGNLESERFELVFGPRISTGLNNVKPELTKIYTVNNTLYMESNSKISEVKLFNVQGVEILSNSNIGNNFYMQQLGAPTGVYIVKAKLGNGQAKMAKVIVM